jgi:hypothetical protein
LKNFFFFEGVLFRGVTPFCNSLGVCLLDANTKNFFLYCLLFLSKVKGNGKTLLYQKPNQGLSPEMNKIMKCKKYGNKEISVFVTDDLISFQVSTNRSKTRLKSFTTGLINFLEDTISAIKK